MKKLILPLFLCVFSANATELTDKGYYAYTTGDFETAKEAYTKAIEIEPNNYELYYNRALSEIKLGNYNEYNLDIYKAKMLIGE